MTGMEASKVDTSPSKALPKQDELGKLEELAGKAKDVSEEKFGLAWTESDYEQLRLCRNRAYHKVNKKRRMHLPASLSSFLLREWQQERPDAPKISAKNLLSVYTERFENTASTGDASRKRPRSGGGAGFPSENSDDEQADKMWTDAMLESLLSCGERVDERLKLSDNSNAIYSEYLLEEWKKMYPKSTFTGKNLQARLTVFMRTRSETPPPASKRKREVIFEDSLKSTASSPPTEEVPDEFAPEKCLDDDSTRNSIESQAEVTKASKQQPEMDLCEDSTTPSPASTVASVKEPQPHSCEHWMHMFSDCGSEAENCHLTSQLLKIREDIVPQFPSCDIYHVKKPKGFTAVILRQWKKIYPQTDESIKSISVKFQKYDGHPNRRGAPSKADSYGVIWTEKLLDDLSSTKRIAREKAGRGANSALINRHWKREWIELYPHVNVDWKIIANKYETIQGHNSDDMYSEIDTSDFSEDKSAAPAGDAAMSNGQVLSSDDSPDDKVKGFRNWTSRAKDDLLNTKARIVADNPHLEPGSSGFNRLLLQEFQRLHPKCMESSRSIYAKVQSIERESNKKSARTLAAEGDELLSDEDDDDIGDFEDGSNSTGVPASLVTRNGAEEPGPGVQQSNLEGFEDWSYDMIRDFISCMDVARRKYSQLKERDPANTVKLVPLLLDMWKESHPDSRETVKSFLAKINHLKLRKNVIKEKLAECGLLPKMEEAAAANTNSTAASPSKPGKKKAVNKSGAVQGVAANNGGTNSATGEFKWHRSMITDVILSRKRALEIKEQGFLDGKKLSFHILWAEEFRKLHPGTTFNSNNLSVHFWSWRKHQQRLGYTDPLYDESLQLLDSSRPAQQPAVATSMGQWTAKAKRDLLQLGKHVESTLANPNTPNELKLKGFAGLLHLEWSKRYSHRIQESARMLNAMYAKVLKEGIHFKEDDSSGNKPLWTPLHNTTLRQCVEYYSGKGLPFSMFTQKVMEDWRKQFPKSSAKNSHLLQRIKDLIANESFSPSVIKKEGDDLKARGVLGRSSSSDSKHSISTPGATAPAVVRKPNARGQMCWNKQTIVDLFNCHARGLRRRKQFLNSMAKKEAPMLSHLVHEEFLKLHPYCKLTPAILMAKCYCWKNAMNKGSLKIDIKLEEVDEVLEAGEEIKEERGEPSLYHEWSKEVLADMQKARLKAIQRKLKQDMRGKRNDVQGTLIDFWLEEFQKKYPSMQVSKTILLAKYRWLRKQKELKKQQGPAIVKHEAQPSGDSLATKRETMMQVQTVRKDILAYIKEVMEKNRIYLPKKLPSEPELRIAESEIEQLSAAIHMSDAQLPVTTMPLIVPNNKVSNASQSFVTATTPTSGTAPAALNPLPPTAHLSSSAASAVETLAQFHQRAVHHAPLGSAIFREDAPSPSPSAAAAPTPRPPPPAHEASSIPLNLSIPSHIKNQTTTTASVEILAQNSTPSSGQQHRQLSESEKKDAIKLPGGATLVAVTDRNADTLLKPKPIEKPDVTITIGEKGYPHGSQVSPSRIALPTVPGPPHHAQKLQAQSQPVVLPINVPKFTAPSSSSSRSSPAGPLASQIRPFGLDMSQNPPQIALLPLQHQTVRQSSPAQQSSYKKAVFIPSKVKMKMDEVGISDAQFLLLLDVYERARTEFFDVVQRGYLAFFPYVLGYHWRKAIPKSNSPSIGGRKLVPIVEAYIEERSQGNVNDQEYLTKRPCNFEVTEHLLKQILTTHFEVSQELAELHGSANVNPGIVYQQMCKRWAGKNPNYKVTTKQLISIYEMLVHDPESSDGSPEVACAIADVWKTLDKEVPEPKDKATFDEQDILEWNALDEEDDKLQQLPTLSETMPSDDDSTMDEDTFTMEQIQEWVSETQNLSPPVKVKRPRFLMQNIKFFWTLKRLKTLEECCEVAALRWRLHKRLNSHRGCFRRPAASMYKLLYREWKSKYPECKLSEAQVIAKAIRQIRYKKHQSSRADEKILKRCRRQCEDFFRNEDLNEVIEESTQMSSLDDGLDKEVDDAFLSEAFLDPKQNGFSLSRIRCVALASNANRDFNRTDDVIDYIREIQRLSSNSNNGRGHGHITWTPEVIHDLLRARDLARSRKLRWEEWAKRKFGGVSAAYGRKDSRFVKVDEMFYEEWCKIRPDMAHLSMWTLVAYARKFDSLQRDLIEFNKQKESVPRPANIPPTKATIYYPNSGLPKFDLCLLEQLPDVAQEVKDLIRTRQLAKERQLGDDSHLLLAALWEDEWLKVHPTSSLTGSQLLRNLFRFESHPDHVAALKYALARSAEGEKPRQSFQSDERPEGPLPRYRVFPEDEKKLQPSPFNFTLIQGRVDPKAKMACREASTEIVFNMQRDIFSESMKCIDIPCLELERVDAVLADGTYDRDEDLDDERICLQPGTKFAEADMWERQWVHRHLATTSGAAKARYICDLCHKEFHNINNLHMHFLLHEEPLKVLQHQQENSQKRHIWEATCQRKTVPVVKTEEYDEEEEELPPTPPEMNSHPEVLPVVKEELEAAKPHEEEIELVCKEESLSRSPTPEKSLLPDNFLAVNGIGS